MNPLTQIKNTQKITKREIELGLFEKASWHDRYKHSAYIFAGGLDFDLTEGDLLAVFAQYGELVDVHLVRDKQSGKSRGFAFLAYEDQRSTVLAVDNLNGATVAGRKVRVEHVDNYKKRKAELTGEDPDAIPDEPLPKRQHSDPSASERRQAGQQQDEQQPRGEAADGRGSQPSGGRLADAWQMPGSLFSLLTEAEPPGAGAKDSKEKKPHKEHKHKKEKHKKKDKHRERSRSRSKDRSRSRDRGRSKSPQPQRQHGSHPAATFGPPRPPPRGHDGERPGSQRERQDDDRGGHRSSSHSQHAQRPDQRHSSSTRDRRDEENTRVRDSRNAGDRRDTREDYSAARRGGSRHGDGGGSRRHSRSRSRSCERRH